MTSLYRGTMYIVRSDVIVIIIIIIIMFIIFIYLFIGGAVSLPATRSAKPHDIALLVSAVRLVFHSEVGPL